MIEAGVVKGYVHDMKKSPWDAVLEKKGNWKEEDNDRHGGQDSNKRVRLLLGRKYNRGNDQRYNW